MPPRQSSSSSSSSDPSGRGEQRPTLPPIRQIFERELRDPVPSFQTRQPSSPHFNRLQLAEDDPRYMARGASPSPYGQAPGTPRSYPTYPDMARQPAPSHPRNASDPAAYPAYPPTMPQHTASPAYPAGYPPQYAHHPRTPIPTGSYPYAGAHPMTHVGATMQQPYPAGDLAAADRSAASRYECSYCNKRFTRPSSLRIHLNTHTGEKPFTCPYEGCGRSFSVQSNMRRHARVHTRGAEAQGGDLEEGGESAEEEYGSSESSSPNSRK